MRQTTKKKEEGKEEEGVLIFLIDGYPLNKYHMVYKRVLT